ncbi:MAG: glycoside hydrolase family 13 protein [Sphaerochaeta sp.]|nr:glycoside hydrolase family 13 protein [Sphaerochaeta sp.]
MMNKAAIKHRTTKEYVISDTLTSLIIRLTTEQKDIASCSIFFWKRNTDRTDTECRKNLAISYRDSFTDDWRARIQCEETVQYIQYYFELTDSEGTITYLSQTRLGLAIPEKGFFEYLNTNQGDVFSIPSWAQGIVHYQIFPERFAIGNAEKKLHPYSAWDAQPTRENFMGGDLKGIQNNLSHLCELGIDCIYLNPIFLADFNHKYATTDYYQIDPDFGTTEDLKSLVHAAHEQGIRILLDGVFNHVGCNFMPFDDLVEKGPNSAYRSWFYAQGFPLTGDPLNYRCVGDYQFMPKLNFTSPEVRAYILDVMLYWIREAGIDGWRLDVADEVDLSFWSHARYVIKHAYPEVLLLGETWGDGYALVGDGQKLDSVMNYLFKDAVTDFFGRRSILPSQFDHQINNALSKYPDIVNTALYNPLGSHDTERFLTSAGGNKARLQLAVAFQMTYMGSPAIYYGDEIGMEGGNDPGCRSAMIWERSRQDSALLAHYKRLIQVRKQEPCLKLGDYHSLLVDDERNLFGFVRRYHSDTIYVVFNNGSDKASIELPVLAQGLAIRSLLDEQRYELLLTDDHTHFLNNEFMGYAGKIHVSLEGFSMQIIKQVEVLL